MPKKRIDPAVKELVRKMPLELTCQKISELTGISMATISRIRRNIDCKIIKKIWSINYGDRVAPDKAGISTRLHHFFGET